MKQRAADEFLRSIYLGDRSCKAIRLDCWQRTVSLEVDLISRIRSAEGTWDFYSEEDIVDGRLVFTGVHRFQMEPSGVLPNDLIHSIRAQAATTPPGGSGWLFEVVIAAVSEDGTSTEVVLRILGADVHLEDPAKDGARIRD